MARTPRKRWENFFREHLDRVPRPPATFKIRVGQGVHLLCEDANQRLFHVTVSTCDAPGPPAWAETQHAALRYTGKMEELPPDAEAWLHAIHTALMAADVLEDWPAFLSMAGQKKGISVRQEQTAAEAITSGDELVVRLLEPCNAKCDFCGCIGVMNDATFSLASAEARLTEGYAQGYRRVVFTGGEPTLLRDLPDYVTLAKRLGYGHVNLQTNGFKLRDRTLCEALKQAGLDSILLSLHSHRAEVHDHVLKLPGGFDGAVAGIDHCIALGIKVHLNFVLHDENLTDLVDYLTFVYKRFDREATPTPHGHVGVTLSFVSPVGWTLEHLERIPRISDAAPLLAKALSLAEALGLEVHVPGLCGVPLCTMPGYETFFDEYRGGTPPELDTRSKPPACAECSFTDRCSGYWNVYFQLYGTDEIGPHRHRPWARSAEEPAPSPALLAALRKLAAAGRTAFAIAQLLNKKRVRTPRGGRWTDEQVTRVLTTHGIDVLPPPQRRSAPAPTSDP